MRNTRQRRQLSQRFGPSSQHRDARNAADPLGLIIERYLTAKEAKSDITSMAPGSHRLMWRRGQSRVHTRAVPHEWPPQVPATDFRDICKVRCNDRGSRVMNAGRCRGHTCRRSILRATLQAERDCYAPSFRICARSTLPSGSQSLRPPTRSGRPVRERVSDTHRDADNARSNAPIS
jgi:hypothetical protein